MSGNFVSYQDADALMTKIAQKISGGGGTIFTRTLTAGDTTITIMDQVISADSMIDIYANVFGIAPTNIVASAGTVTVTFNAQQNDISVKIVVR